VSRRPADNIRRASCARLARAADTVRRAPAQRRTRGPKEAGELGLDRLLQQGLHHGAQGLHRGDRGGGLLEQPLGASIRRRNGNRSASGLRGALTPLVSRVTQKMDGGRFCVQCRKPPPPELHTFNYTTYGRVRRPIVQARTTENCHCLYGIKPLKFQS
jgi:hypothetical protein